MGWSRQQYRKLERKVRHGRGSLHVDWCQDCGRVLPATHSVMRFGRRCRGCSQMVVVEEGEVTRTGCEMVSAPVMVVRPL